jgi:hypothetical protein
MAVHDEITEQDRVMVMNSRFYREHAVKVQKVMEYKWLESEKAGFDIGLDKAWIQWQTKYHQFIKDSPAAVFTRGGC